MFHKLRAFLLSLTIVAVLVFSAAGTTVAYADEAIPPDSPPTEVSGGECSAEEECPPVETGTVTVDTIDTEETFLTGASGEGEPAEEEAPPAEAEAAQAAAEKTTPAKGNPNRKPVLAAIPENTNVAVVDAQGKLQPLAGQAAANALATKDPIWCPAGQAPTAGANGCTQSFTSFTALLNFLANNAAFSGAGTIFVEQGAYLGGESIIDFNSFNLTNISGSELTVTGGWNPATGTTSGTSTFNNVSIIIGNTSNPWGGSLTLNNLTITNPAQTGIKLNTQGSITLTNVSVSNSTNGAGAELTAAGNVTVEKSKFERNKTAGAIIRARGDVAISDSSFSNPANARRQINGLDIISDGSVSLFQVLASGNRQAGATIDAAGRVTIVGSDFSGTKSMMGTEFLGYGLTVVSKDAIDLDGVTANDNFLWGASLTAAGDVTIANSTFNANTTESTGFIDDTGLLVTSGGNVSIFNSHADNNRLIGATIKAVGDVTISGSTFSGNRGTLVDSAGNTTFYGYGLQVITDGNISLDGVTASNNNLFGAHLEAGQDITITGSDFSNNTTGSAMAVEGRGLEAIAGGNVFLSNVTLTNNQTFGANIQSGSDVFLNAVTASGNGTDGVIVQSNCGTLFLVGGTYSNNGQYGLSVLSTALLQTIAPVFANNGAGNIFLDPGTCVFTPPPPPPPPPSPPPAYKPNDPGAAPVALGAASYARTIGFSDGAWDANAGLLTLNGFLASLEAARSGLNIGAFTGMYAYVHLSSGMQIVVYSPAAFPEIAMNGS